MTGDILHYQVHSDNSGKKRAVNARIEGVSTQKAAKTTPKAAASPSHASNWLLLTLLIFGGLFVYNKFFKAESIVQPPLSTIATFTPSLPEENFECDGRQHCSQMNSRNEALFFIRNCPNTKMDGDHDGNPCENDSRF